MGFNWKQLNLLISFILILNFSVCVGKNTRVGSRTEVLNKILIDYLQIKGILNVVMFDCGNDSPKSKIFEESATRGRNPDGKSKIKLRIYRSYIQAGFFLKINHWNGTNAATDLKLSREYRTAIFVDATGVNDCTFKMSQEILKFADTRHLFTTNNFWIVYVNDFNSIALLFDGVFVTPDSDVKIFVPTTSLAATEQSSWNSSSKTMLNRYSRSEMEHDNIDGGGVLSDSITRADEVVALNDGKIETKKIAEENLAMITWMLIDVYRIASLKQLKMQIISSSITNSFDLIRDIQKYGIITAKRKNLEGIKILCGVVIEFPDAFTTFEDVKTRHINTISKVNYPLMTNLKKDLNFGFNLMQMDNYGWNHSNGQFDGMMGHFQHGTIDFGVNALFMRLDRLDLCDFVAETFNIRACIIFRQPPLSAVENIFTLPFAIDVWISCLIFIIITTILLVIQLKMHPIPMLMDLHESLVFVWGAICQQGTHLNFSNAASGRYIVLTTFISSLFLFTSFSANIVALLQSPSEAIKTVNDLTHSPLDAAAQDVKYNKIYFKEVTDPETQAFYHKKIESKGENAFIRPHQGMEKVRKSLFAYQVESQAAYQIISDTYDEHEKCGLKELELFQLPVMSIPVKKTFPYKEIFRQRLRWQRENGLMNREFLKWLPAKPQCENKVAGFVSIGLTESRYPLIYFCSGFGIACTIFMIEIFWHYTVSRKLNKLRKKSISFAEK